MAPTKGTSPHDRKDPCHLALSLDVQRPLDCEPCVRPSACGLSPANRMATNPNEEEKVLIVEPLNQQEKIMDEKKRQVWRFVIQTAISILTAIATALGVTSCMAAV